MQRLTTYRRAPVVQKALNLLDCQVRECDCLDSPDAVRDYLQLQLGLHPSLFRVAALPTLPRTAAGKLDYPALQRQIEEATA